MADIVCTALKKDCTLWALTLPDYNKGFVDAIKGIPPEHRGWSPATKSWLIDGVWIQHAADLAVEYFPSAQVRWVEEVSGE